MILPKLGVALPVGKWGTKALATDAFHGTQLSGVGGYTATFSLAKAMDPTTLVASEMTGSPQPQRHGFPVRITPQIDRRKASGPEGATGLHQVTANVA